MNKKKRIEVGRHVGPGTCFLLSWYKNGEPKIELQGKTKSQRYCRMCYNQIMGEIQISIGVAMERKKLS